MALSCDLLEGSSRGLAAKINKSSKNIHGFYDKSLKWRCIGKLRLALGRDFVTQTAVPSQGLQQLGCTAEYMRSLIRHCSPAPTKTFPYVRLESQNSSVEVYFLR